MSSSERMMALLNRKKPDRVPVLPFIQGYAAQIAGLPLDEFWTNGDAYFEANYASMRLHGYDQSPISGYAACGPWEFGGKIGIPNAMGKTVPYVIESPVKTISDIEKLNVPLFDGPLPGMYAFADRVAHRCVEKGMPAGFQVGSIFSAAAQVAETGSFLTWVMTEPKAVHLLMKKVTALFINALDYFVTKYGAKNCLPIQAGPLETNRILSPEQFEELVYPYNLQVNKRIKELGIEMVLMHPCANQNLNIPHYVRMREECGWHGRYIWIFGPATSIKSQMEAFGEHDIICGNIDPLDIRNRSYEEVVDMCRSVIAEGKDNPGGFILAPGCVLLAETAPIKVMALMDAAERFGRYA